MTSYRQYLLFAFTTLACLFGCTPTPPADPMVDAGAPYAELSRAEIIAQDLNLEPVSVAQGDNTDSDFWEVVERNEDGSTHVHVYVVDYEEQMRTRSVIDGAGQTGDETYSIFVPMEEVHCVTVPAGVDVEEFIEERYSPNDGPIEPTQAVDFVPEAPVEDYSP